MQRLSLSPACDLLSLHRLKPTRYPALFASTASSAEQGRHHLLLVHHGETLSLRANGTVINAVGAVVSGSFLHALNAATLPLGTVRPAHSAPVFIGGWALLLDYELTGEIEPQVALPSRPNADPIAIALRCPAAIIQDPVTGACQLVVEPTSASLVAEILADIAAAALLLPLPVWQPAQHIHEDRSQRYLQQVDAVLRYLRQGDVFQVNLSRAWHAQFAAPVDPAALFARLCRHNPAPFAGLFVAQGRAVVSSSPERLVAVRGKQIQIRPIAGTRPHSMDGDQQAILHALKTHPKERAEHLMLIDLGRNDLGRICVPGSIIVDELMTTESYAHVHHIVSNVTGQLPANLPPGEIIRAVFPGGTITGCPKVRCLEIIAELEQCARGAYTGAMGWLGRDGDLDFNILIRTAEVQANRVTFRTGAGIVADSVPERELQETRAKAQGLLRALT